MQDDWQSLSGPSEDVAPRLLGCLLVRELDGHRLVGRIVETEAYDQTDAASHSYTGPVAALADPTAHLRPQSGNFFRPAVGTTTPDRKKIIISQSQMRFTDQLKPRLRQGRTPRTNVMFGPAGHLYVYFTYGMHYCMNVVCGPEGHGSAVLVRAIEPLEGEEYMAQNRQDRTGVEMTNGPAKVCQALAIDRAWNGHDLHSAPLQLMLQPPLAPSNIVQTTRVGLSQAKDVPWRFYMRGNRYVSKP